MSCGLKLSEPPGWPCGEGERRRLWQGGGGGGRAAAAAAARLRAQVLNLRLAEDDVRVAGGALVHVRLRDDEEDLERAA